MNIPNLSLHNTAKANSFNKTNLKISVNPLNRPPCNNTSLLFCIAQSLRNKILELDMFLRPISVKVLCVYEHWLTHDGYIYFKPDGYEFGSIYCRENIKHGSVIFVSNDTSLEIIDVQKFRVDKRFEVCAIKLKDLKLFVTCLYRTPDGDIKLSS